jgi:putative SOS response-associated peptidase YedK
LCGRFEIHSALEIITKVFGIDPGTFDYSSSYNIAPSQDILLVVNDGKRRLARSRWGFVPSWSKELSAGYKMINARAESVADKPSFRSAFQNQRCLVVADGFYEWKKEGTHKRPFYIRLKSGKPFGLAGLYNVWKSPEGEQICTSTIITTDANEIIQPLHDRMPVILSPDAYDLWLDPNIHDKALLQNILKSYPSEKLEVYEVTPKVNSPKNNAPENIQKLADNAIN